MSNLTKNKLELITQLCGLVEITKEQSWLCLMKSKWDLNDATIYSVTELDKEKEINDPLCPFVKNKFKPNFIPLENKKPQTTKQKSEEETIPNLINLNTNIKKTDIQNKEEETKEKEEKKNEEKKIKEEKEKELSDNKIKEEENLENSKSEQDQIKSEGEEDLDQETLAEVNDLMNMDDENSDNLSNEKIKSKQKIKMYIQSRKFDKACKYIKILAKYNKKISKKFLFYAIENGSVELIRLLHELKIDLNRKNHFLSAVHTAVMSSNEECLEALLELGADPNVLNFHDKTPIEQALKDNQTNILKILLKYNASLIKRNKSNIFVNYSFSGDTKKVKLLLESGVDVNEIGKRGMTSFLLTKSKRIKQLIQKYSKTNLLNPLENIEQNKREEIRNWLANLPNTNHKQLENYEIDRLFDIAISNEFKEEMNILADSKFKLIKVYNGKKLNLLHLCVYYSNYWLAKLLVSKNPPLKYRLQNQKNPIILAAQYGNVPLFCLYYLNAENNVFHKLENYENTNPVIYYLYLKLKDIKQKHSDNKKMIYEEFKKIEKETYLFSNWIDYNDGNFEYLKNIKTTQNTIASLCKYQSKYYICNQYLDYEIRNNFIAKYLKIIGHSQSDRGKEFISQIHGYFLSREDSNILQISTIRECNKYGTLRDLIIMYNQNRLVFDPLVILSIARQICNILNFLSRKCNFYHRGLDSSCIQINDGFQIKINNLLKKTDYKYSQIHNVYLTEKQTETSNLFSFGVIIWELLMNNTFDTSLFSSNSVIPNKIPQLMIDALKQKTYSGPTQGNRFQLVNSLNEIACTCLSSAIFELDLNVQDKMTDLYKALTLVYDRSLISIAETKFMENVRSLIPNGEYPKEDYIKPKQELSSENEKLNSFDQAIKFSLNFIQKCVSIPKIEILICELLLILKQILLKEKENINLYNKKWDNLLELLKLNNWKIENKKFEKAISKKEIIQLLEKNLTK
ncbi:ankyrin repeat-containing protein [Anaeramoeba flamelloides]|uniref:Ankyrin repeat-containing protein n=1 Tax=Anaeramoeba flamelloides TaxID=1746091 RepID=A0ABQ8ZCY6_9EUKA|nr:ankyrin repeat-containing protein [Anaeramoeba flamelloides]